VIVNHSEHGSTEPFRYRRTRKPLSLFQCSAQPGVLGIDVPPSLFAIADEVIE
jgi:hypothetical protein